MTQVTTTAAWEYISNYSLHYDPELQTQVRNIVTYSYHYTSKTYITIDRPNSGQPPAYNHDDTIQSTNIWNEGLTVNKMIRRREKEDGEHDETEETFWKFVINLGSFPRMPRYWPNST